MSAALAGNPDQTPTAAGQGRDTAIDFLRAACILYIVGYWHLVPYTHSFPGYANVYTECLKDIALGTFVFCSGLLLAGRPVDLAWTGVAQFYRRRVIRIYPLYLLALLGFGMIGMASTDVIVRALLLVSMFLPPAPYTLWFISMIMTFYLLTPWLLRQADHSRTLLLAGLILMVVGIMMHQQVHPLDTRMLQYLPCFLLGLAWKRMPALAPACARRVLLVIAALLGAFLLYRLQHGQELDAALGRIPTIVTGTVLLYLAASRYSGRLQAPWITRVAYASFCVYLFHRLVFHYAIGLYFPVDAYARLAYLMGVVLPLIVVLSYYAQRLYDRVQQTIHL